MLTFMKLGIIGLPLLLTSLAPLAQAGAQTPAQAESKTEGTILIIDKDNAQCSLSVPGEGSGELIQYEFKLRDSACKDVKPRKIKFDKLPSATEILITDGLGCSTKDGKSNFWIKLLTISRTDTDWFEFEDLVSYPKEEIISKGLEMVDSKYKDPSEVRDKAQCVRVITSARVDPPTPVPVEQNKPTSYDGLKPHDRFTCGLHQVMVARANDGDAENGKVSYTCSTFKQASTDLTVAADEWSDSFKESDGVYFMCPPGKVMTGMDHSGDENGPTKYRCSSLYSGDKKLSVIWSDEWSDAQQENDSEFLCPKHSFLVGRRHIGDENDRTFYRCATAQ
ncbi:hypothetical protein [Pseudomonas sp. TWI628]|uniref:hypothetical protein n=1 Tax=Pseudomonas sp. TWI628 TaxID=3136788 RepID=UPI00320AEDA0